MQNVLKPSGEKAIASPKDRFWSARAQLTFTYTAILAVILCISSSIIYTAFSNRIAQRFDRFPPRGPIVLPEGVVPPRAEDVLQDLINSLILVNSLLLVLASIVSYWLAGVTLEPIQAAYERQRRFLSDASHELRTPLAILQADLENTRSISDLSDDQQLQIESHLEEVHRMAGIVSDLLLLSRLDEALTPTEVSTQIDLASFLEATQERFQTFAAKHDVTLTYASPLPTFTISTKPQLLTQALGNVIKNAIIYNKPNGTVHLTFHPERTLVRIEVNDTGIGMSPKDVDKIFERFYRADKSRSRQTGGSGLGLAITRTSIEQLHGIIEVKSQLDQGTKVTITLPLTRAS